MRRTLLIADSDPIPRLQYEHFFIGYGFEVVSAGNTQESWNVLRAGEIALAVINWNLRGDCRELLDKMREEQELQQLPVVLLLGELVFGDHRELTKSPVIRCLRKPFPFNHLRDTVIDALAHLEWQMVRGCDAA